MEPFNFDKLPEVIRRLFEMVERIEELLQAILPVDQADNELLNVKEAAEFLKITIPALYSKVSRQEVPFSKPARKLYFNKNELKKWIIDSRRKTITELRKEAEERLKILPKHRDCI